MTIDEAIAHARLVADENRANAMTIENNYYIPLSIDKDKLVHNCEQCAEEHEQLAEWLEGYKKFLEFQKNCTFDNKVYCYGFDEGYDKGKADVLKDIAEIIDDYTFVRDIKHNVSLKKMINQYIYEQKKGNK